MKRIAFLLLLALILAGCKAPAKPTQGEPVTAPPPEQAQKPQPQVPSTSPPLPQPAAPPSARLIFVGDIMLDRIPGQAIARGEDPFAGVAALLDDADLTIGNLECVIATVGEKVPKLYNFRAHPRNVPLLARHLDAVSLANNHSGDYGKQAFLEQLDLLAQGKVAYFGGGRNSAEAYKPLLVERNGIRLAVLGYNEIELRSYEAGPSTPGLAWSDDARVVADITAAKAVADLVVVYPHWGLEYQSQPSARQRELARKMIDAGAALIVGSHPHVTQTVEYYKGGLIIYSLGNFVFDDYMDVPPALNEPSRISWILRATVGKDGVKDWDTVVARTDDRGFPQRIKGVNSPCGKAGSTEIGQCKPE